ncbi:MAG: enoyl-CoA hydratase-related protein [Alphaproteobacteria bacterium]
MGEMLLESRDEKGVVTLTLNRPEVHNAFDDALIARLAGTLQHLGADETVRAVVLAAAGASFCAGADLNWIRRTADFRVEQNLEDARALAAMLRRLDNLPKPTLALVHGAALGGGVGLVAACDIAVAGEGAVFGLSEVKLGLAPAVIAPYLVRAVGARAARRLVLTAERFDAAEALRIGLVHEVVPAAELAAARDRLVKALAEGGPRAQAAAKATIAEVAHRPIDDKLTDETAEVIAELRASPEGREGVAAFLGKRPPSWRR